MPHHDNVRSDEKIKANDFKLPKVIVVDQPYTDKFPLSEALKKGTLFPNLYDPYVVKK